MMHLTASVREIYDVCLIASQIGFGIRILNGLIFGLRKAVTQDTRNHSAADRHSGSIAHLAVAGYDRTQAITVPARGRNH